MSKNRNNASAEIQTVGHIEYFSQLGGSLCGVAPLLCGSGGHDFVITSGDIQGQDPFTKTYIAKGCGRELIESTPDISAPADRRFTINAYRECGGISELMYSPQLESVFYEAIGTDPSDGDFDMITVFHGENPSDITPTAGSLTDVNTKLVDSKSFLQVSSYVIAKLQFSNIDFTIPVVDSVYFGEASCAGSCGCSSQAGNGQDKIAVLLDAGLDAAWPIVSYSIDGGSNFSDVTLDLAALSGTAIVDTTVFASAIEKGSSGLIVTIQFNDATNGAYVYIPYSGLSACVDATCNTSPVYMAGKFTAGQATDIAVSGKDVFFSGMGGAVYKSSQISAGKVSVVAAGLSTVDFTRIAVDGDTVVVVGADNAGAKPNGILYSKNNGSTWKTATNPPGFPAYDITSVAVKDSGIWEIGTSTGLIYRTCDFGCTWADTGIESPNAIDDIAYASDQVGYAITEGSDGNMQLYYTIFGGALWWTDGCDNRGLDFEGCDRSASPNLSGNHGYRIAFPTEGNLFVRVNHMFAGGRVAAGDAGCGHIAGPKYTSGK